ncbi:ABC transporter substrate-binding protein [Antrihabitans sp. YC2-6]|uniref:ABC transporter substrate-binding protein n=1 Tax=Antrihabitans sp. YC2-6 TaxID=2799498 RepID=UPI0018F3FFAF|nr:ABC transporter substrate-binding protein [Antrihabitans sp. YC2-6]MBJ8346564.1 carbohydrate ABC transporter substrate-binding protein [Antrihabitans sp. YC2-6]
MLVVLISVVTGCNSDADNNVEVFTWWSDASEQAGLNALVEVFNRNYPDLTFINGAVAGGAGGTARDVLASRLAAGDPPGTFQVHAGMELADYIEAGQVQDLGGLYAENGWDTVFPRGLLDLLTVDGKIYSVPSNVHRANVVWGNPAVLSRAGIDPQSRPADLDAWFAQLDALKAAGVTPLAIGKDWTQVHLLETVLISRLGSESYKGLFDGETSWADPRITAALADFGRLLSYANTDNQFLDWPASTKRVIDGKAAYTVMGDWAENLFRAEGMQFDVDYVAFPVPGTQGAFDFLADSFTLPANCPNESGAVDWLETVASIEGQQAFNLAKGSIPARSDVSPGDYQPYQQTAMTSYRDDVIVPSLAHGAAAPVRWLADITTAVRAFGTHHDPVALQQALVDAAATHVGNP